MYILMISRGIPSKHHPQWGCFEKDQAEALVSIGHKVVVMSVDARFKRYKGHLGLHHKVENGVEYYNYVTLPAVLFTKILGEDFYINKIKSEYFKKVFQKIIEEQGTPDVIYSQFFWNTVMGVELKNRFNIPLVGIEHLARFNESSLSESDFKWASYAFDNTDVNIAVAGTLASNLEKRFHRKFEVVHNMYGAEFEHNGKFPFRNTAEPIRFISTASLVKRKGFDTLIEAFSMTDIPKSLWKLDIIGWGEEKDNLENLIRKYNLQSNIRLLGKMEKSEIVEELKQSNVFVLPSRNENFSVAVLEALAIGLPILATDCGGIRECINDKNGIIVPVDDIQAMSNAIVDVIKNYQNFDRDWIVKDSNNRFSPKSIALDLTAVFDKVRKHN